MTNRQLSYLRFAGLVFKMLTVFAISVGLITLLVRLSPLLAVRLSELAVGVSGFSLEETYDVGVASITVIAALVHVANTLITAFMLLTAGVVLDFLAGLGEEVLILRKVQWDQTKAAQSQ